MEVPWAIYSCVRLTPDVYEAGCTQKARKTTTYSQVLAIARVHRFNRVEQALPGRMRWLTNP